MISIFFTIYNIFQINSHISRLTKILRKVYNFLRKIFIITNNNYLKRLINNFDHFLKSILYLIIRRSIFNNLLIHYNRVSLRKFN